MAKHEVKVFSSLEEMSWAAVCAFEDLSRLKAVENKTFSAALSGGRLGCSIKFSEARPSPDAFDGRIFICSRWMNAAFHPTTLTATIG